MDEMEAFPVGKPRLTASLVYYNVSDMTRAVRYYAEALGLPLVLRFADDWAEVDAGPITIGLHLAEDGQPPSQGGGTVSFTVKDIEALVAELHSHGAQVGPVRATPRGKIAMVRDPDGNLLHLIDFAPEWLESTGYARTRTAWGRR